MTIHERLIKDECGYTGRMPFWDELAEVDNLAGSELWSDEYFGGNGTGEASCIETGPFANLTLRFVTSGVSDHCLTRQFSQRSFSSNAQPNIDRCNAIQNFTSATTCCTCCLPLLISIIRACWSLLLTESYCRLLTFVLFYISFGHSLTSELIGESAPHSGGHGGVGGIVCNLS